MNVLAYGTSSALPTAELSKPSYVNSNYICVRPLLCVPLPKWTGLTKVNIMQLGMCERCIILHIIAGESDAFVLKMECINRMYEIGKLIIRLIE